jgi:hypothetical protein
MQICLHYFTTLPPFQQQQQQLHDSTMLIVLFSHRYDYGMRYKVRNYKVRNLLRHKKFEMTTKFFLLRNIQNVKDRYTGL